MENLVDRDGTGAEENDLTEPLVTFPDPDTPPPSTGTVTLTGGSPSQLSSLNSLNNLHNMSPPMNMPSITNMTSLPAGQETMKFEQKKMTSASKTKVSSMFNCKKRNVKKRKRKNKTSTYNDHDDHRPIVSVN